MLRLSGHTISYRAISQAGLLRIYLNICVLVLYLLFGKCLLL